MDRLFHFVSWNVIPNGYPGEATALSKLSGFKAKVPAGMIQNLTGFKVFPLLDSRSVSDLINHYTISN
ncbi:MAG: hypothetical protein M3342_18155 [Bacteroidota bacterium]|nr:hypothetical protein [Bacteroidota bacterium]